MCCTVFVGIHLIPVTMPNIKKLVLLKVNNFIKNCALAKQYSILPAVRFTVVLGQIAAIFHFHLYRATKTTPCVLVLCAGRVGD